MHRPNDNEANDKDYKLHVSQDAAWWVVYSSQYVGDVT